jgi:hypothetical protein
MVWFMVCNRCEVCVHGSWFGHRGETCELCSVLAIGVRPVSFGCFGYRGETCELCLVLDIEVRLVSSVWFWQ